MASDADTTDAHRALLERVYRDSGLTDILSRWRADQRKDARWWLRWTAAQMQVAEAMRDWQLVTDVRRVIEEVGGDDDE